jgi:rare lipoprotein A
MNIATHSRRRIPFVRALVSAGLCAGLWLALVVPSPQAMEVERTDLEPWEPVIEEPADDAMPWAPPVAARDEPEPTAEIEDDGAGEVGIASYYGRHFHGRRTASGHPFDASGSTAAHRTLPLGTEVSITNLANGKVVTATITDRGPFIRGRIIDVSRALAARLGFIHLGKARVRVAVRGFKPLDPPPRRPPRSPR